MKQWLILNFISSGVAASLLQIDGISSVACMLCLLFNCLTRFSDFVNTISALFMYFVFVSTSRNLQALYNCITNERQVESNQRWRIENVNFELFLYSYYNLFIYSVIKNTSCKIKYKSMKSPSKFAYFYFDIFITTRNIIRYVHIQGIVPFKT